MYEDDGSAKIKKLRPVSTIGVLIKKGLLTPEQGEVIRQTRVDHPEQTSQDIAIDLGLASEEEVEDALEGEENGDETRQVLLANVRKARAAAEGTKTGATRLSDVLDALQKKRAASH